jgi:hypothetical protein
VVNFNGPAAQLTQTRFSFDLDADGTRDHIAFLKPGSGFLALDRNFDGRINDGRELFGPQTGSGFGELSRFDTDGNRFIDENDAVFDKLRVWTKDGKGEDHLFTLREKGIGAIFLGRVSSQFALRDTAQTLLGQLRSTGLFIKEEGGAGTVQQLDIVV